MLGSWRQFDCWVQDLTVRQMIGDACRTLHRIQLCGQYFTGSEISLAVIDVYQLTEFAVCQEGYYKHKSSITVADWKELFQTHVEGLMIYGIQQKLSWKLSRRLSAASIA